MWVSDLGWRLCLYIQGMKAALELFGQGLVNRALARNPRFALKSSRDDFHPEMGFPLRTCACMTGMAGTIIGYIQDLR